MNRRSAGVRPSFKADVVGSLLRPQSLLDARAKLAKSELIARRRCGISNRDRRAGRRAPKERGTEGLHRRRISPSALVHGLRRTNRRRRTRRRLQDDISQRRRAVEFAPPRVVTKGKLGRARPLALNEFNDLKPIAEASGLTPSRPFPRRRFCIFAAAAPASTRKPTRTCPSSSRIWPACTVRRLPRSIRPGAVTCRSTRRTFPFSAIRSCMITCAPSAKTPFRSRRPMPNCSTTSRADARPTFASCMHMCRGNHESSWVASGGYEPVAEIVRDPGRRRLLPQKYDTDRAGGFEPLRHLSGNKVAVLGLVTTKKPAA